MNSKTSSFTKLVITLAPETQIVPLCEIPSQYAVRLEARPGEFAVFRPNGRSPAKLIGSEVKRFIERLSESCPVSRAIIAHAQDSRVPPEEMLGELFPVINELIGAGFLIRVSDNQTNSRRPPLTKFRNLTVLRPIQLMDDVEVYCVRDGDGRLFALKIATEENNYAFSGLQEEAVVLERLSGLNVPALLDHGSLDGRHYLLMEWIEGVTADRAADAIRREASTNQRGELHKLISELVSVFADIHERHVLHGDINSNNVLMKQGGVFVLDFGLARNNDLGISRRRGGVGHFFEPEYAFARITNQAPPQVSVQGEQYSIAVLAYRMATGYWYLDLSLERNQAFRQIVSESPKLFSSLGVAPWPDLEEVLQKALSKEPGSRFGSVREFADAIAKCQPVLYQSARSKVNQEKLHDFVAQRTEHLLRQGGQFETLRSLRGSINSGLAGMAYGLHRVAVNTQSAEMLELADVIVERVGTEINSPDVFFDTELGMSEELVTRHSVVNASPGIPVVRSLIAHSRGDDYTFNHSVRHFIELSRGVEEGKLDFVFGQAGTLNTCATLIRVASFHSQETAARLAQFGNRIEVALLGSMGQLIANRTKGETLVGFLGAAHGWAGFLYAVLRWSLAVGKEVPAFAMALLHELADLSVPVGRGFAWPRRLPASRPELYGSWCNGAAGFVHLWIAAHRAIAEDKWLALAEGAVWTCWDSQDPGWDLCCGAAGRAYALMEFANAVHDRTWRDRAMALAVCCVDEINGSSAARVGLYKGATGVLVLASDLISQPLASMPFFGNEP